MNTKLKHVLANILVCLLVLEPFSFAMAGGITVAPGAPASKQPTLDAAANGVPVVNIVKPNASGLSHNQFDQFNVAAPGVIINNSNRAGVSQLGGAISGNANFGGGAEARIILNEVTGSSRSGIEGYTEIFGFAAQYILANPNGISVNGGGFINTPKATLTTGAPRFDAAGGLLGLDVHRGDVLIEGQGFNAGNLDAFEIISRTAKINAELHARNLSIIAGQSSYDPATGQSTPLAPNGSAAPTFALDSTALGGMYAQRITLVGTEAGVGVNLGGTVRATEQLTLTADGKIQLAGAVSSDKDAAVASRSDSVEISGKLGAGGTAAIEAAQELRLASLAGGNAPLLYGSTVTVSAGKLTNVDGKVLAEKTLSATVAGDLSNAGTLFAGTHATLAAGGALANSGEIQAKGTLAVESQGGLENSGTVQAGADLTARSGNGLSNTGTIAAKGALSAEATGSLDNSGTLYSDAAGAFQAGTLNNHAGARIETLGDALFGTSAGFTNAGTINAGGKVAMGAAGLLRNEATGQMLAQTGIGLEALGDFANLGTLGSGGTSSYNVAGQFLNSGTLSHSGSGSLSVPHLINDATGQILFSGDSLLSVSGDLTNSGLLYSGGKATYRVGGTLLNNRGQMLSQGDMLLEGITADSRMAKLQNDSGGIESLGGGLAFRAQTMVNNNLDFSLEEGAIPGLWKEGGQYSHSNNYSAAYSTIFNWATGHSPSSGTYAMDARRLYFAYAEAIGLDTTRNVFSLAEITAAVAKAEQELLTTPDATRQANVNGVKSNIIALNAPYSVMCLPGQRCSLLAYEAITATDRAVGLDKGGSIAASTNISIEADDFRNNVSKVSTATGDIDIDAASFENVGQTLYERTTVKWGRGFKNSEHNKGTYSEGNGQEVLLSPVDYAYGTVSAGGAVTITAAHVNNGIAENAGGAGSGSAVGIISPAKPGALGQTLPSVNDLIDTTGLFSVNATPGHHYLVETNPALTSMASFYGSDYFLSRAGIDLDKTHQQLLGDAFYETRLVREQVFALTGRRLLSSSVTSDAEQMQALMDSALRAKSSLDLTIGVALSEAQIAQLTEDIVWLEKTVVDGHEVLAPKVYLASASLEKIAQGGSVIVGKDVTITTTDDVENTGVIQAANTLTINASNIFNTLGTLQGQTAALAATGSLTNTSGLIKGDEVTLAAGKNIVSDTATVTFASSNTTSEVANQRGRIEASGSLNMQAGESISLVGSDAVAGGSATLSAGKDVILSTQQTGTGFATSQGSKYNASASVVNNEASTLSSGGALSITAGQDAVIHGSTVQTGGDATLAAGRNLSITSATDTYEFSRHLKSKGGGLFGGKSSESASGSGGTNVASQVTSGGSLSAEVGTAGSGDLVVSGSTLASGGAMSLKAADELIIASAQNTSSSSYSSSNKGTWSSKTLNKTANNSTVVKSELKSGDDMGLESSGRGVTIKASKLESGGSVRLESASGEIALLTDTSSSYSQEKKTGSNVVWQSTRDKGNADQTVEHTEITATGAIQVIAAQGIRVEYRDTGNVGDSITQLAKQPGLAWMEQLRSDPKVNWQAVAEAHEKWDYKSEGLTGAGAALLSLAVAVATSGWGSGFATTLGLTNGSMAAAAVEAGFASLCSQAAVGLVNNKGDLLATLQGLASDQGMRALASAMLTASLTSGLTTELAKYEGLREAVTAGGLAGKITQDAVIGGTVQAGVGTALYGGDLGQNLLDGLRGAAVDSLGADLATRIGKAAKAGDLDYVTHKIAHAALGGAMAAADGGDAASGALGAVVGEVAADALSRELKDKLESGAMTPKEVESWIGRGVDISKLTAGLAAAAVGGDVNTAAHTGGNAAENNCYKALLAVIYSAVIGKGDLKDGLAQIGRGGDPLSKAINGVIVGGVKLAAEAYPQETKLVLELLTEAGGLVDATVTYLDKKSGGYVSTTWSSIPKTDRDAILGLITVVTLDTNAIKKVAGLKQTAVEAKTAEKAASAAKKAEKTIANTNKYKTPDGSWVYPPNDGFLGPRAEEVLSVGTKVDRYGTKTGNFLAPKGTPFEHRSLPPDSLNSPYTEYVVIRPLPVQSGKTAPWFEQQGGGTQFKTMHNIEWLIKKKYIKEAVK